MATTIPVHEGRIFRAGPSLPALRRISPRDIGHALRAGYEDFMAWPSHAAFLVVIYPIVGLLLAYATAQQNVIALFYPLLAGFAILGPFAALGLYEVSRRRELGEEPGWRDALSVMRRTNVSSMLFLGAVLLAIFVCWLAAAQAIYALTLGTAPDSFADLLHRSLYTRPGWALIILGNGVGFLFAALAFTISVISFPLMLERRLGAGDAIRCSVQAVRHNPGPMALWGLIVAGGLAVGSAPLLIGLTVVLPILGHATWHLYRRVVVEETK
jgi:uncharacterized membrane protein